MLAELIKTIGIVHWQKQEVGCIITIPIDEELECASRVAIGSGQAQLIMGNHGIHELRSGGEIRTVPLQQLLQQLVIPMDMLITQPFIVSKH
ncbi:hypothetical protein AC629_42415 [Bradyrhizobium sp. NAS80.1]|nr:hypothetical protein AC629_42415 [Bradyrhizobium sp. NAS80.1]